MSTVSFLRCSPSSSASNDVKAAGPKNILFLRSELVLQLVPEAAGLLAYPGALSTEVVSLRHFSDDGFSVGAVRELARTDFTT